MSILKDGWFKALETVSYLFSTLAFSFSTHALIRAYLFSVSTLERIISEDRYKSICSVKKKNIKFESSNFK
jgi:hypothetical protein